MNGRVYDPVLGRFLSADPFVQDGGDSQAYNRYSYLTNNPLGGTDPSGYFSLKDAVKIVAVVVAAYFTAGLAVYAMGGVTGLAAGATATFGQSLAALAGANGLGLSLGGAIAAGAGAGFASGFAGSLLNGGSIGDAFKAGVIGGVIGAVAGGLTYGIGGSNMNYFERAAAHGVVGGAAESAGGGQFRHGFYAGFATAIASPGIGLVPKQVRFVAAAVVGGTASALGGGKFANGAITGAFQYLLNDSQHGGSEGADSATATKVIAIDGAGGADAGDNPVFRKLAADLGAEIYDGKALSGDGELMRAYGSAKAFHEANPDGRLVIMGYSAGGHEAVRLANMLGKDRISVDALITFDPHRKNFFGYKNYALTGGNVRHALNFYQRNSLQLLSGTNPFRGSPVTGATNINLTGQSVDHVTIVQYALRNYSNDIKGILGK